MVTSEEDHTGQTGFLSGMHDWFNMCKSINVKHNINRLKDNNMAALLDSER